MLGGMIHVILNKVSFAEGLAHPCLLINQKRKMLAKTSGGDVLLKNACTFVCFYYDKNTLVRGWVGPSTISSICPLFQREVMLEAYFD